MALHSLYCADVPWRNCSLTHSLSINYIWFLLPVQYCEVKSFSQHRRR